MILGRMLCRYSHALNFPGSYDHSTAHSQFSKLMQVDRTDVVFLRVLSKTLLFTCFSVMVGMVIHLLLKGKVSSTFPLFSTSDLNLAGLKLIRAYSLSFSTTWIILLKPDSNSVVSVRSMKTLMEVLHSADFILALCCLAQSRIYEHVHNSLYQVVWYGYHTAVKVNIEIQLVLDIKTYLHF